MVSVLMKVSKTILTDPLDIAESEAIIASFTTIEAKDARG